MACELLTKPHIQNYVKSMQAKVSDGLEVTAQLILKELRDLATVDLSEAYDADGKLLPVHEIPKNVRKAISSIEVFHEFEGYGKDRVQIGDTKKVKFYDKTKALELLGKHLTLFTDKVDHSSKDGSMAPKSAVVLLLPSNGSEAQKEKK